MRRYIVLLLITGIVWAQTDFDKLVLKDGTTYVGEYSKIEGEIVYFKPQNAFAFQTISIKLIQTLQLKDGQFIIGDGKDILTYEEYQKNSLEEYQKLSTKEKAIYDAKSKNLGKWYLFGPMSTILFGGCVLLKDYFNKKQGLKKDMIRLESPIFLGGSLAASLTIPYFVLNRKEKINFPKSILTDSEKEIYKQAYSKKLKQRKIKYAAVGTIVSFVTFAVVVGPPSLNIGRFGGGSTNGFTGFGP